MTDLKERWADVHKNSPEGSFWEHEWLKHGTCAIRLEPLNTELKYFKQGKTRVRLRSQVII
jgi:ribonuclease T2